MRARGTIAGIALLAAAAGAEVIDRIAVTIENQVIAESQVRQEIRAIALLNGERPDLGPASRRKTAERLVDQLLMRREMIFTRYPGPDPAEVEKSFHDVRSEYGSQAAFDAKLAEYGIDAGVLRESLARQAATLRFIELRFRPEVQAQEGESEASVARHVDERVERWLKDVKSRTRIRYEEEAFE
jgi:hypothetical protein